MNQTRYHIPEEETLDRRGIEALQRRKLRAMLAEVMGGNEFYRRKFSGIEFDPERDPLSKLPFTRRKELEQSQLEHPPFGNNLTYPREKYCRFHQTSGSGGRPMRWLDTKASWDWWKRCWGVIFTAARVDREDRLIFPFSFGPFIGFWAAFEGAGALGNLTIPAGGLSTEARLKLIVENAATVVCCTPTYALRMAEVAAKEGVDLAGSAVRALVVAGEPGGHIAATRRRIEEAWGARLYDHTGMTEVGPIGFECHENPEDVHLLESECIAEVLDPETGEVVGDGEAGELVITNLGRVGSPVIRYRTGDQVRVTRGRCACGRHFARMKGGVLGRIDDMFIVRGNNVFPSAVEAIVRRFPEVAEFRVEAYDDGALTQVRIEVEPVGEGVGESIGLGAVGDAGGGGLAARVQQAVQNTLSFRAEVRTVKPGTLPRFEMKAKRFVRRKSPAAG